MSPRTSLVLDHGVVECGGVLTGVVSWSGNTRRQQVGVALRYETQGRGDTDTGVVARCSLGVAAAGQSRFRLDVPPQGPVTYNGQLLRLFWQAIVLIPVTRTWRWPGSKLAVADVTVAPRGWLLLPVQSGQPSAPWRHDG